MSAKWVPSAIAVSSGVVPASNSAPTGPVDGHVASKPGHKSSVSANHGTANTRK